MAIQVVGYDDIKVTFWSDLNVGKLFHRVRYRIFVFEALTERGLSSPRIRSGLENPLSVAE